MLFHLALDGFWLVGAIVLAVLIGIFISQYVKDVVTGVPSSLRTALSATETSALSSLKLAEAAVVADITKKVSAAVPPKPVITVATTAALPLAPTGPTGGNA